MAVWRAAVFAARNDVPGAASAEGIPSGQVTHSFAAEGTYQTAAKTVERPQLLLLTLLQARLSTKGATWLRLLCAVVLRCLP